MQILITGLLRSSSWKQQQQQSKQNYATNGDSCMTRLQVYWVLSSDQELLLAFRHPFSFVSLYFNRCGRVLANRANSISCPSNGSAPEDFVLNETWKNPRLPFQLSWLTPSDIWADAHIHSGELSVLKAQDFFFYSKRVYRFIPLSSCCVLLLSQVKYPLLVPNLV